MSYQPPISNIDDNEYQSKPAEIVLMRHFKLYDVRTTYIDKLSNKSRYTCFQIECDFDKLYTFLQMDRWDTPILRFTNNLKLTGFREGSYYTLISLEKIDGDLLGQLNIPYRSTHLIEDLPCKDQDIPQGEFQVNVDRSLLYMFHEYEFIWFNHVKKPYIIHGRFEESIEDKFWVDCVTDCEGKVLINSKMIQPHGDLLHGVLYGLLSSERV